MAFFACGTHFEQAPALRPAPRFCNDSAVRVRWAEWNLVSEGAGGALALYICWERQVVGVVPVYCLKAWVKAACWG